MGGGRIILKNLKFKIRTRYSRFVEIRLVLGINQNIFINGSIKIVIINICYLIN